MLSLPLSLALVPHIFDFLLCLVISLFIALLQHFDHVVSGTRLTPFMLFGFFVGVDRCFVWEVEPFFFLEFFQLQIDLVFFDNKS